MTITTWWRRITLQASQRGFTDARTFIAVRPHSGRVSGTLAGRPAPAAPSFVTMTVVPTVCPTPSHPDGVPTRE